MQFHIKFLCRVYMVLKAITTFYVGKEKDGP